nr:ABC transporter ATP-binding protein [uncultured Faecalimonas sp.]
MNEYLLKTYGLTKQYGHMKAVDHVNLHLKKGAIYGFIGRNGAGKTTFLKMISGLASPTSGEIELFGYRGQELKYVRSRIGCLIEEPGLYGNMTATENLRIKCKLFGIDDSRYLDQILHITGLYDTGKKRVKNFSLGMKQRLGIALALIGEPDLLILDEPINGLDPQGIADIRDTLLRLNEEQQITILISSHILEELEKLATHYGIIHHGTLLQELTKEELLQRCSERIELILEEPRKAIPVLDQMHFTDYEVVDERRIHIYERLEESGNINMELAKHGILIKSISIQSQELESYFLNLTGGETHV